MPWIAASVSTRVVSWKEAAESHDSVASEALVMPISTGRPEAGLPPSETTRRFSSSNRTRSTRSDGQQVGVTGLDHRDPAQHLPHDDLDVLVVDRHALAAVDRLDLVDQVLLGLADTEDAQHVLRVRRTDGELLADLDVVAVGDQQARALADTGYSCTSEPSSGVTRTLRALSVSSISTRPAASEIGATTLGLSGPRRARPRGADPA